jgi:hypothetical protein
MSTRTHHVWIRQVQAGKPNGGKFYISYITNRRGIVRLYRDGRWSDRVASDPKLEYFDDPCQAENMLRAVGYPQDDEKQEKSAVDEMRRRLVIQARQLERLTDDLARQVREFSELAAAGA